MNGEKTIEFSWHLPISIEIDQELPFQLLEEVDIPWLEFGIPCSGYLAKSRWEGEVKQGIRGTLNLHEKLVALEMV